MSLSDGSMDPCGKEMCEVKPGHSRSTRRENHVMWKVMADGVVFPSEVTKEIGNKKFLDG